MYALQRSLIQEQLVFFLVGGVFLVAALNNRSYGLSVPGCILLGLGFGTTAAQAGWSLAQPVQFGLGLGFLAIYALDRLYFGAGNWWPLIPGAVLMLVGIGSNFELVEWFFREGWPLAIALVGLVFVLRGLFDSGRAS